MVPSIRASVVWAAVMGGIGGLAVYATAPRVSRPAFASVAPAEVAEAVEDDGSELMPPEGAADYATRRAALAEARLALAARRAGGEDVVELAQDALAQHLGPMIEAWVGTPYDFFGISDEPVEGGIACGFFVSTVLRHAGFDVRRLELGEQASELIVRTLVSEDGIERFLGAPPMLVVQSAVARGPGIYLVGLDTHTGFIVHDAQSVRFCHATSRAARAVVCEIARDSPSLQSEYTVLGKLGDESAVEAWLTERTLDTVLD